VTPLSPSSPRYQYTNALSAVDSQVLLPTGVLRVECRPGTPNFRVAEDVVWRSDRTTAMIGVVPWFKGGDELNAIGTAARAVKIVRVRNRSQISYTLLLEGVIRVRVKSIEQESPFIRATVEPINETSSGGMAALERISGVVEEFRKASRRLIEMLRTRVPLVAKFQPLLDSTPPEKLCDLFVGAIDATFEERLAVLNETDPLKRFDVGLKLVQRQLLVLGAAGTLVDKEAAARDVIKLRTRSEGSDATGDRKKQGERGSAAPEEDEDEEDTVCGAARRAALCVRACVWWWW
jgi:ATP-dependent Lon protease